MALLFWTRQLSKTKPKNTQLVWPFPWKQSVWQNPDHERTNENAWIYLKTTCTLPYNKYWYFPLFYCVVITYNACCKKLKYYFETEEKYQILSQLIVNHNINISSVSLIWRYYAAVLVILHRTLHVFSVLHHVMMYNVTTQFDSFLLATEANKFCPLDKNALPTLCVQCKRYLFISVKCISMVSFLQITVLGFVYMYMCTYLCVVNNYSLKWTSGGYLPSREVAR